MANNGYKALTIDLWDTLVQEVPRKNPTLAKIRVTEMQSQLASFGFDYDEETIDRAYRKSGEYCDSVWAKNKDIPTDDHLAYMLDEIDTALVGRLKGNEYSEVKKNYAQALLRYPPVLMEGVMQTLEELSSRGYSLGLISNTGRTPGIVLRIVLEQLRIASFFDHMVFSDEVLVRKPEKRIFLDALRGLGASPAEALHIGNDPKDDYEGARLAGMSSVLLDRGRKRQKSQDVIHSMTELVDLL